MEKNVTEKITEYIINNNIDVKDLSRNLEISEEKLMFLDKVNLTAEEFLNICSYLHIKPERFINNK